MPPAAGLAEDARATYWMVPSVPMVQGDVWIYTGDLTVAGQVVFQFGNSGPSARRCEDDGRDGLGVCEHRIGYIRPRGSGYGGVAYRQRGEVRPLHDHLQARADRLDILGGPHIVVMSLVVMAVRTEPRQHDITR